MLLGNEEVIKRYTDLETNQERIYLKVRDVETEIIEILIGTHRRGEYFLYRSLINLEVVKMQDVKLSYENEYYYKGCVISFECDREVMDLTACIKGDIEIKNRYIDAGYADAGNDVVSKNIKKALEIAMKQIDEVILTDRDKIIRTMALPSNIRELSEKEKNEIICETIIKLSKVLKKIQCDSSEYQLSQRQQKTKSNAINNIKSKDFLGAYYEIVDFVDDYGDRHNGKVFEMEKKEINNLISIIYNNIKQ